MSQILTSWSPRILSVLRIMTALLFMQHGLQKIVGWPPSEWDQPEIMSLLGVAGLLELIGGALLVIGLFTRPTAFVLSGFMAVAYFLVHASQNFMPILNGGELPILYCFVFLYLVFAGAGSWSLDAKLGRN